MMWPDQGLRFDNEINSGQKHTRPSRGGSARSSPPPTAVVNPSSPDSHLRPTTLGTAQGNVCRLCDAELLLCHFRDSRSVGIGSASENPGLKQRGAWPAAVTNPLP